MFPELARTATVVALVVGTQGCAAAGLAVLGASAGVGGGTGVGYTLDSIVYKTFTAPEKDLRKATLASLKRMAIDVTDTQVKESGTEIMATAGDRTVDIELDRITPKTSRMRVNVKQGWFFRDRATATEIILQTERALEEAPAVVRTGR